MNVDKPPRISEVPAKVAPLEVLPEEPEPRPLGGQERPIHALSALTLAAVDSLWAVFEWAPPVWLLAIPLCFLAVFAPTFLIQRYLKNDSPGRALTFATLLAVLAAIPIPVMGTAVGLGLLAWAGLGKIFGARPPKQL